MNLEARLKKVVKADPDKYSPESIMRVHQFILWTEENPDKRKPWQGFEEVEDFELYYNTNPELAGKTRKELWQDTEEGVRPFYPALRRFCEEKTGGDKRKMEELLSWLPRLHNSWQLFESIDDYRKEYETNPNFKGKTPGELGNDTENGGMLFYRALRAFCDKEPNMTTKRFKELTNWMPRENMTDWSSFTTIDDFKNEYETNPGLKGKTSKSLKDNDDKKFRAFYYALIKFCRKESRLTGQTFREQTPWLKRTVNDWSRFTTIDDFRKEYETNPNLNGKTPGELIKDIDGGNAYYVALNNFCNEESIRTGKEFKELTSWLKRETPYRSRFTTIDEFRKEYETNPNLKGKTATELNEDTETGGGRFYSLLFSFCKEESERTGNTFREQTSWIKRKQNDWSRFTTLDDFKKEYETNPNLKGKTATELENEKENGGSKFYGALKRLYNNELKKTGKTFKELTPWISKARNNWSSFKTLDDFREEYETNPDLKNKTPTELTKDTENGGNPFYSALGAFCKKEYKRTGKTFKELTVWMKKERNKWLRFTTIADYRNEYQTNPCLKGKTASELYNDKENGGYKFYRALRRFIDNESVKRGKTFSELTNWIRSADKYPKYDFGSGELKFGSSPERVIAILLNKYGLLKAPEEGFNIHVKTNGKKQHNLDFLVGNTFIEYHPVSMGEKNKGLSFEDIVKKRWNNITNPAYQDHWFWMIEDVAQLYDVLQDPEINPLMKKRYQNMTYDNFLKHIKESEKKARDYDLNVERKKRERIEIGNGIQAIQGIHPPHGPSREYCAANSNKASTENKKAA